jgi:hypothetical protein
MKLSSSLALKTEQDPSSNTDKEALEKSDCTSLSDTSNEKQLLSTWKNIFVKTFEDVDDDLRQNSGIDCICSGTTAVTVVRQVLVLQLCKIATFFCIANSLAYVLEIHHFCLKNKLLKPSDATKILTEFYVYVTAILVPKYRTLKLVIILFKFSATVLIHRVIT